MTYTTMDNCIFSLFSFVLVYVLEEITSISNVMKHVVAICLNICDRNIFTQLPNLALKR